MSKSKQKASSQRSKNATVEQLSKQINSLTAKMSNLGATPGRSKNARRRRRAMGMSSDLPTAMWGPTSGVDSLSTDTGPRKYPVSSMLSDSRRMIMSTNSDTSLRRLRFTPQLGLSEHGIHFLKCAFAPPDFQSTIMVGVQDEFRGNSLTMKHSLIQSRTLTAGRDYWIVLLPTPGIAFWAFDDVAGANFIANSDLIGQNYSDFGTLFGFFASSNADIVNRYRVVSNHIEIIPTVNQMTWTGQIQAWKTPISLGSREATAATSTSIEAMFGLQGIQNASAAKSNQYTGPFIRGFYGGAFNANSKFDFQKTREASTNLIPSTLDPGAGDFGRLSTSTGLPGFDNEFESLVIKISGVTSPESFILKTWSCVEYQIQPTSALYGFQSLQTCDLKAMELYREIITGLPIGVPFEENGDFWQRVLRIVQEISNYGSMVPGPIGLGMRGVNMLSQAGLGLIR